MWVIHAIEMRKKFSMEALTFQYFAKTFLKLKTVTSLCIKICIPNSKNKVALVKNPREEFRKKFLKY